MIVIDDFVKDRDLLARVAEDETFFGACGCYMWWDGWSTSSADTLKKELIAYIWREHPPLPTVPVAGFEYWTGRYTADDELTAKLDLHVDKDEFIYETEGRVVSPLMGSVFYPVEMDIDGGYLEIFSRGAEREPERLEARFNRLVVFPAGDFAHRVTPVTRGIRSAMAVNLWDRPPVGVENGAIEREAPRDA